MKAIKFSILTTILFLTFNINGMFSYSVGDKYYENNHRNFNINQDFYFEERMFEDWAFEDLVIEDLIIDEFSLDTIKITAPYIENAGYFAAKASCLAIFSINVPVATLSSIINFYYENVFKPADVSKLFEILYSVPEGIKNFWISAIHNDEKNPNYTI
jgi:hypothetical protein